MVTPEIATVVPVVMEKTWTAFPPLTKQAGSAWAADGEVGGDGERARDSYRGRVRQREVNGIAGCRPRDLGPQLVGATVIGRAGHREGRGTEGRGIGYCQEYCQ